MSAPRLTSDLLVGALLRRVQAAGGFATVLHRGDAGAGALLVLTRERDGTLAAWERGYDLDGAATLVAAGPVNDSAALDQYVARRRLRDRDLWVIELDIAEAKRFAAETVATN